MRSEKRKDLGGHMEYKDFNEAMRCLVKDNGKDKLLGDKVRGYILDYKGQFDTEATIFLKLLAEGCAKFIFEADNVLERKRQLVERMEDKYGISPKKSTELLDLLGFLLKDDTTKCVEEPADDLYDKGEAAWDHKDFDEAISLYRKAAEKGHVKAQFSMGRCYELGMCLKQDYAKAVEWYRKAAEQNNTEAQYKLGIFYHQGKGVKEDCVKAVEWLRKAAEQDYASAQYLLGSCYYFCQGVSRDEAKAVEWYRKAAEQGNVLAQSALGECYRDGSGVAADYAKAAEWFRKAAEQGESEAQEMLDALNSMIWDQKNNE